MSASVPSASAVLEAEDDVAISAEHSLQDLWTQGLIEFKSVLSSAEYERLRFISSPATLTKELEKQHQAYRQQTIPEVLEKLKPCFDQLRSFAQAISIFVQSNPRISGLIWGSVFITVDIALRHEQKLETVVQTVSSISQHLPRVQSVADLYVVSGRIKKAVCGLYHELIEFFVAATKFFARTPTANVLGLHSLRPWRNLRSQKPNFTALLDKIEEHTRWVDVEANHALHRRTHEMSSRNHEEILSAISNNGPLPSLDTRTCRRSNHYLFPQVGNHEFFGRSNELNRIYKTFTEDNGSITSIVSITGEGGVGKSQLALQFAYSHRKDFTSIFWVAAETKIKLAQGFEYIAVELELIPSSGAQRSLQRIRDAVKKWLRTTDHNWLLIFDSAESIATLDDYWPTGTHGCVLITTQNQHDFVQLPVRDSITLKCFSSEEGTQFLLKNLPDGAKMSSSVHDAAMQIHHACGGLPLALAQVVRYIRSCNISVETARDRCSSPETFINTKSNINRLEQKDYYHPAGLSTLWQMPMKSLGQECRAFAQMLAHLDPENVPEAALKWSHIQEFEVTFGGYDKIQHSHIPELLSHSLISKGERPGSFSMHRLIQAAFLTSLPQKERIEMFTLTVRILDRLFPQYDDGDELRHSWEGCALILPQVNAMSQKRVTELNYGERVYLQMGGLLERSAWYLQERGMRTEAESLLTDAIEVTRRGIQMTKAPTHDPAQSEPSIESASSTINLEEDLTKLLSDIHNSQGALELNRGRFDKALNHLEEAISLRSKLGLVDEELIYMKRNTGIALSSLNRFSEAYAAFQESMASREMQITSVEHDNPSRRSLALIYRSRSSALLELQRHEEAWRDANRDRELGEQVYGNDHVFLSDCYTNMGKVQMSRDRLQEAEKLYLKALDIRTRVYGAHEATALSLHNHANVLAKSKRFDDAIDGEKAAVDMLRRLPDAKHILARSLYYLGSFKEGRGMCGQSEQNEARMLYQEHVGSGLKKGPPSSFETFDNLLVHYYR